MDIKLIFKSVKDTTLFQVWPTICWV